MALDFRFWIIRTMALGCLNDCYELIQNYGTWLPESCYGLIQDYGTWLPERLLQVNSRLWHLVADDHPRTVLR